MPNRLRSGAMIGRVGVIAALVVAVGGGWALASGRSPVIHACASQRTGALRIAKKCAKHASAISWNATGPRGLAGAQGPAGARGPAGAQGPAGVSLFARVDDTGVLHQHSPGVTVTASGFTGLVFVNFPLNISNCAVVISQGEASNNGFVSSAQYTAVIDSDPNNGGNPQRVDASSFTDAGTAIAAGFDLIVAC